MSIAEEWLHSSNPRQQRAAGAEAALVAYARSADGSGWREIEETCTTLEAACVRAAKE